jgi:hypothetical protein
MITMTCDRCGDAGRDFSGAIVEFTKRETSLFCG